MQVRPSPAKTREALRAIFPADSQRFLLFAEAFYDYDNTQFDAVSCCRTCSELL
jgi:hypothetical protein